MQLFSTRLFPLVALCGIALGTQRVLADDGDAGPDPEDGLGFVQSDDDDDDDLDFDPVEFKDIDRDDPGDRRPRRDRRRERRGPGLDFRPGPHRGHGRDDDRRRGGFGTSPGRPDQFRVWGQRNPEMLELVKRDRELERTTREMSARLHHVSPANVEDAERIKDKMMELVHEHFDVRQDRRELELNHLRERLEQLEESIERRNEARDEIISRRISELTGEEHDLSF